MLISKLDTPEVIQFIQENLNENPAKLALKATKFPNLPIREIADQIASRQRAQKKLPEWCSNEGVIFPLRQNLEQASSERTARFKARFLKGKNLLDLTSGTGIDAFYLCENFEVVHLVEPNEDLCALLGHNFDVLGKDVSIHQTTAEEFLKKSDKVFDVIYLDPSRRPDGATRVFGLEQYLPNVIELLDVLLEKGKEVVIKTSPMIDIPKTLKQLPVAHTVITLAVDNEMKEVIFILKDGTSNEVKRIAVNLKKEGEDLLEFTINDEQLATVHFGAPETFIYDPNSAIKKAGAFRFVSEKFGLKKIHPATHLYTSNEMAKDFPGRVFRFKEFIKPEKKILKRRFPNGKVNVISKNYPLRANDLKKKFRLNDGGNEFLFFCEIEGLGKSVFVCENAKS